MDDTYRLFDIDDRQVCVCWLGQDEEDGLFKVSMRMHARGCEQEVKIGYEDGDKAWDRFSNGSDAFWENQCHQARDAVVDLVGEEE